MYSLSQLVRFLRPYRKEVIIGPLLMAFEVAVDLMQPWLMRRIIDVGVAQIVTNYRKRMTVIHPSMTILVIRCRRTITPLMRVVRRSK